MIRKRLFLSILLTAVCSFMFTPSPSLSAGYPDRSIQLIIANAPGATGDITARMLAEELEKILGQKVIPNNKPGAGTVLGVETAARSKKDGYTLFYGGVSGLVYAPVVNPEVVRYDPAKALEPLGFHYYFPTVVGVRADAPWKNFQEFAEYAKKNPGKYVSVQSASVPRPTSG